MTPVSPDDRPASGGAPDGGAAPGPDLRAGHGQPLVRRTIVADALLDPAERRRLGFPEGEAEPIPVVVELNLRHHDGLTGAMRRFRELYAQLPDIQPDSEPELVAETYYRCQLSVEQVRALVAAPVPRTRTSCGASSR